MQPGQAISVSDVLQCPAPSQYFVGREDTQRKLSKIFSVPIVTIWSTDTRVIRDFITQKLEQ